MEKTNYTISFSPAADAVDVDLPASKSISNRALTIAAMADGCSIGNIADCDDTNAMRRALLTQSAQANVNIGAAGTAMRFLTAYFASQPWRSVLLDGVEVGEGAIVAAGSVVSPGTKIGAHELWMGVPAKFKKMVDPAQAKEMNVKIAHNYLMYSKWYEEGK